MTSTWFRALPWLLATVLALAPPSAAMETPLSDTAVREAYFLGQRRDETMARFLERYTKRLPGPKSGPHIATVTLFTPFAQVVLLSRNNSSGYSAQQAGIDHRGQAESVQVLIDIDFTASYGASISQPASSRSGASTGYVLRAPDFWKDFEVRLFDGDKPLRAFASSGHPKWSCGAEGGCGLVGATLTFKFWAADLQADSVTVVVDPPEGKAVAVDFDLTTLR